MTTIIHNRKAGFNYEIIERFEAGLELLGQEVKSLRNGQGSLDAAYVSIKNNEAWLIGMFIPSYQPINSTGYDAKRDRRLLLTQQELLRLSSLERGLTIVPLLVYNKKRWFKVEIAAVRGKKRFDKRETLKKRDTERQVRRQFSDR